MHKPLILLGAGGHAKVLLDLAEKIGLELTGVCDPGLAGARVSTWRGLKVLGDDDVLSAYAPTTHALINGLGSLPCQQGRRRLFKQLRGLGYNFPTLVHPSAVIGTGVKLAAGVQVMAGVVIQADTVVGENCIINTRASIDHDCEIGAHCHIAPGSILCGATRVGEGTHIGTGANIVQGIVIGAEAIVGAGTTILRDVAAHHKVIGASVRDAVWIGNK